jgi:hypothetical protein
MRGRDSCQSPVPQVTGLRGRYCRQPVFVSDLRHFLDITDDAPGPARKMAEHLASIVQSPTAAKAGAPWETALPCRRRPGNRPCHWHIAVFRTDLPASIEWRCTVCGDEGVISGWEGSFFDLRQSRCQRVAATLVTEVPISCEVCATLRDLRLLESDCELLVFRARAAGDGAVLSCSAEDLDELIGYVAAEANHETNRRLQKRLDLAFAVHSDLLNAMEP